MQDIMKKSASRKAFLIINYTFFALVSFLCFYPLWYVFVQSLSDSREAVNAIIVPIHFTFENYKQLLNRPEIFGALGISLARTVIGTAGTVLTSMLLGYVFSKQNFPFRKLMYRILVITMYINGGLIPVYLVYKSYGLINNFWVYILPGLISGYYVILVKTYVEQIPVSLEESAMIDGANVLVIFARIIFPLALPIAATIAIYVSVNQWNSWFDNQIYTVSNENLTTLQFLLYSYLQESETLIKQMKETGDAVDLESMLTPRGVKMTVTMITVIPILCVYPFMQRYLVKGIMIGAVKG